MTKALLSICLTVALILSININAYGAEPAVAKAKPESKPETPKEVSKRQEEPKPETKAHVKKVIDKAELGKRYLKLGNTYREAKEYKLADKFLTKGLNIAKKSGMKYWEAVGYEYWGFYYRDLGELEASCDFFNKAYKIYKKIITQVDGSDSAIEYMIDHNDCDKRVSAYEEKVLKPTQKYSSKQDKNQKEQIVKILKELEKLLKTMQ